MEAQHLTSYPHGGYPPVPVEVIQIITNGLARGRNPALTVGRILKVFAHPVDSCTVEWLLLARFNGGVLPGLAGETDTIDPNGSGPPLPFNHAYGPLMETVLHLMGHLSSGMPVAGQAPPPALVGSPSESAAGSVAKLSSGCETTSDSEGGASGEYYDRVATVTGARLLSLHDLSSRLAGAAAMTAMTGPPAAGVDLQIFRPDMSLSSWPESHISSQIMMGIGMHVCPSLYLIVELKFPIAATDEPGLLDPDPQSKKRLPECHQVMMDMYVSFASKEEAALLAQVCAEGPRQGAGGPHADVGFVGVSEPLMPVEAHLRGQGGAGGPGAARPSEAAMDRYRRGAAAMYLPQCEALLAQTLAGTLADGPSPADPTTARRLPRRQHLLLKGIEGEWATYD